jgi:hypothetical protein
MRERPRPLTRTRDGSSEIEEQAMSEQSGQAGAGSGVLVRGFLPGLVLGVVLGAAIAFLSTEILGKSPNFAEAEGGPRVVQGGDREAEGMPQKSREELEQLAEEARRAAEGAGESSGDDGDGGAPIDPPAAPEDPSDG